MSRRSSAATDGRPTQRPVGFHVSIAGGLSRAPARAAALGCDAVQAFPSNPRGWALPKPDPDDEAAFVAGLKSHGMRATFFHAPYLINLASPDRGVLRRSIEAMEFALARGARTRSDGVIVHAGAAGSHSRDQALAQTADAVGVLLDSTPGCRLLFELTAGGGSPVAATPEQAGELLRALGRPKRVGFCLDTQHLFAAGFDWTRRAGVDRLARDVDRAVGLWRIACIHVNDSKTAAGSRHDRHENIGEGQIGLAPFRRLLGHAAFAGIPVILETPGGDDFAKRDVELVRSISLRRQPPGARAPTPGRARRRPASS